MMFASRRIISTLWYLPAPAHLFKLSYNFFLIYIRQSLSQTISGRSQFRNLRRLGPSPARWNINTKRLTTTSDSDWCIRLKKTGDPLPEFPHANLKRSHNPSAHIVYAHVYTCANRPTPHGRAVSLGKSVRGAIAPCPKEFLPHPTVSRSSAAECASRSSESSTLR